MSEPLNSASIEPCSMSVFILNSSLRHLFQFWAFRLYNLFHLADPSEVNEILNCNCAFLQWNRFFEIQISIVRHRPFQITECSLNYSRAIWLAWRNPNLASFVQSDYCIFDILVFKFFSYVIFRFFESVNCELPCFLYNMDQFLLVTKCFLESSRAVCSLTIA